MLSVDKLMDEDNDDQELIPRRSGRRIRQTDRYSPSNY